MNRAGRRSSMSTNSWRILIMRTTPSISIRSELLRFEPEMIRTMPMTTNPSSMPTSCELRRSRHFDSTWSNRLRTGEASVFATSCAIRWYEQIVVCAFPPYRSVLQKKPKAESPEPDRRPKADVCYWMLVRASLTKPAAPA